MIPGTKDRHPKDDMKIKPKRQLDRTGRSAPPMSEDFREFIDMIPEGYFRSTPAGDILFYNKVALARTGYKSLEAFHKNAGKKFLHRIYLDPNRRAEFVDQIERHGSVTNFVSPVIVLRQQKKKNPKILWLSESARAVRDASGKSIYYEGVTRDVTKEVNAERALRRAENEYRSIFENATEGIFHLSNKGEILRINPKGCEILGFQDEATCLTRPNRRYFLKQKQCAALFRRLKRNGQITNAVAEIARAHDHSTIWIIQTIQPMQDDSGETLYYQGTFRDITEIVQLQAELTAFKQEFIDFIDFSPFGYYRSTPEGEILMMNKQIAMRQGYASAKAAVRAFNRRGFTRSFYADPQRRNAFVDHLKQEGSVSNFISQVRRLSKLGSDTYWISESARAVKDTHGQTKFYEGISLDVTNLIETQHSLTEANKAKSRFLAAASHDLRQPIQALSFLTSVLADRAQGEDLKIVGEMERCLDNLRQLFAGLIDLGRIDSGTIEPRPEIFDLGALVKRLADDYRPLARQKKLSLLAKAKPCLVHTDPLMVERILRNLIDNAIKHSSQGRIILDLHLEKTVCQIKVIDQGPGVSSAARARIFDEFVTYPTQARGHTEAGLGLGLAIVARLAKLIAAKIDLERTSPEGSCFSLSLAYDPELRRPAGSKPSQDVKAALRAIEQFMHGQKVLILDDEELVRTSLGKLFQSWGAEPTLLAGIRAFKSWLRSTSAGGTDLVVLDYNLGRGKTALDLIPDLRKRLGGVPILVVTGDDAKMELSSQEEIQILIKPISAAKLRSVCQVMLAKSPLAG